MSEVTALLIKGAARPRFDGTINWYASLYLFQGIWSTNWTRSLSALSGVLSAVPKDSIEIELLFDDKP